MKVVLIIVGSLGALYTVFAVIQLFNTLSTSNPGSAYSGPNLIFSGVPVLLGLIVCLACFQRAFRKPPSE